MPSRRTYKRQRKPQRTREQALREMQASAIRCLITINNLGQLKNQKDQAFASQFDLENCTRALTRSEREQLVDVLSRHGPDLRKISRVRPKPKTWEPVDGAHTAIYLMAMKGPC